MIPTTGLASELSDLGQAIGLIDSSGNVDGGWFADPLSKAASILSGPQRDALLRMLDALFPRASNADIPGDETWYCVLGDQPRGNLYLTVKNGPQVVLGVAGDIGSDPASAGVTARLSAQLPLVSANSTVQAVAGTAQGPLKLQLRIQVPPLAVPLNGILLEVSIAPPDVNFKITLVGLALGGGAPRDFILDPQNLSSEAWQLAIALLKQALSEVTAAAGSEAEAVVKHLTGLLGFDADGVPAFPFLELATNPAALQNWLRALTQPAAMTGWLGHLAGLIAATGAVSGDGSAGNPWTAPVLEFNAQSGFSVIASATPDALRFGIRAAFVPPGPTPPGHVAAEAIIASIPLHGTGAAAVLPSLSVAFQASGNPNLAENSHIKVGSLRGGIVWDGATLRPLAELDAVTILDAPVTQYQAIDLTDTDSVAAAAATAIKNLILSQLGTGAGAHLAVLAGLIPPASDPGSPHLTNLGLLVSDPARAIAGFHRAVLVDATHNWSFLLRELANLAGIGAAVSGTGVFLDPWRVQLAAAGPLELELAAWNAQTDPAATQQLRLGLRAAAASGPLQFFWSCELLAFDLPAAGEGDVRILGGQHLVLLAGPLPAFGMLSDVQISADAFHAQMDLQPGSSANWNAAVENLQLKAGSTNVTVPSLRFPIPGGFDVGNSAATALALGVAVPELEALLRFLLARATLSWGGMPGFVLSGLLGVHGDLNGLPADWPTLADASGPGSLLSDPFSSLRKWLAALCSEVSADGTPFLPSALNWLNALLASGLPDAPDGSLNVPAVTGAGTYDDPWVLPLSGDALSVDALAWLEPNGPPAAWGTAFGAAAAAAGDFQALIDAVSEIGAFVLPAHDAASGLALTAEAALGALNFHLTTSDGVVPIASQIPTGDTWTTGAPLASAHSRQPQDPSAISQILAQIDSLAGGSGGARAVLLLGPAFSDHTIWSDLLASPNRHGTTDPRANFDLRVAGVDASAVSLSGVTAAVDYYSADLADDGTGDVGALTAQIGRVVARIGELRPGMPVTLVAHSTAGVAARAFTAASPAQVRGLITLGTPHFGADLPFLNQPDVANAARFLEGIRDGMADGPLRDALDHIFFALDGYLPHVDAGKLPVAQPYPVGSFAGTPSTDTGGVPALALGSTLAGNLLDVGRQAASALATGAAAAQHNAPTHLSFGLRAHAALPARTAGDVQVDATIRTNIFRIALTEGAANPPHSAQGFGVRIALSRPDDWLVGTPQSYAGAGKPLSDVRVRWCEFGVDVEAGARPAPFLTLYQAAYHGPTALRVELADSAAQAILGEVMHAISDPAPGANSQVARLLAALEALGVATPDAQPPGIGIAADAFNAIATDAAAFFAARAGSALSAAGGLLGFSGPSAGPWVYPLGALPIQVTIAQSPVWSVAVQTMESGIALAPGASLSFSAGVTLPGLAPNLNMALQVSGFNVTYSQSTGTLVAQSGWLAPLQLFPPPSAAALAAALNDSLPRLLFSASAGALLESMIGPDFAIPPLDTFFRNTGQSVRKSPILGNPTGDGFDAGNINSLLQFLNQLAGFPASPGLTIPPGFQLTASGAGTDADPVTVHLGTTAPIGGVLGIQLSAAIDKLRHLTPGGSLALSIPLPGGDSPGAWSGVAVTFGLAGSQVSLSIAPQVKPPGSPLAPIQVLPTFSGLGALRGAVEALLPQALDALVDALSTPGPAPDWLASGLALCNSLGIYDSVGHFKAHGNDLRALVEGNYLNLFNAANRANVATRLAAFLNGLGAFSPPVTASGSTVTWQFVLPSPASGTVELALGWDGSGPLAQVIASGVKLASGAVKSDLTLGFAGGALRCEADLGVSLSAALGLDLAPKLSVRVAGGSFQVGVYPLATGSANGPLTVTVAPTLGVSGSAAQLVDSLLVPLVGDVAFRAAQSKLTTPLWSGGPTLEAALVSAGIVDKGATPAQDKLHTPLPSINTIAAGLAAALLPGDIPLAPNLKVRAVHEKSRTGVALQGKLDFTAGNYVLSALFGAPDSWAADSPGANDGLAVFLFDDTLRFTPGLLAAGLGLGITGTDDTPLVDLSGFRLGGVNAYLFFDAELQGGLTVGSFGGGLELASLGLPLGIATSGNTGGNNPVASSLLRSDGGSGGNPGDAHPVNPGVDVDAWFWDGPAGDGQFHILFGGQTGTLWIGVHSGFGPIYIDQLGLNVQNTEVDLLIDGSVKVDGLTAQAYELTVGVPYKTLTTPSTWNLDLQGLAIGFNGPSVEISGALIKNPGPPVEYDGLVLIKISDLGFIAVGAYSTPKDPGGDTYTSLFVFAGVFVAVGIPPIIDISGLGLGIGYNREIIVPNDLNQIPTFLLVEALDRPDQIADDPMGALMHIRDQLPPRRGSFWLAAGLRGTSFAIVNVTAIVYVALDRGVEIGIIGVARMALPSGGSALANIELALKVRFSSSEGLFSIQGQLTSNSYLLSRDCQLTGGFAYFIWFSQSQFLLTLGGYHPAFQKRPEFPDVPRLGYHWSFLGVVAIKGESYFALTNSCVMAGTRFDATYGPGWLFVWFSAHCDLLVSWDPFYYNFDFGVTVGATFRIHIDLFFGSVDIDITVSLGATLHIEGPPFHGQVKVDLEVGSVTVGFGPNPDPRPQPIPWTSFVSKYLHSGTPGNQAVLAHVVDGLQPPEPAGGQPSPGAQDQPWKMKAEFVFRTETRMPASSFSFLTTTPAGNESQIPAVVFGHFEPLSSVYGFDIAPLLIDRAHHGLKSEHVVLLDVWNAQTKTWTPVLPGTPNVDKQHFQIEPVIAQVSEAAYHLFQHDSVPAAANTLPVLNGLKIAGLAVLNHASQPIPISSLYDYGFSRPLPFATWSVGDLAKLKALGAAADNLIPIAAKASTPKLLSAAHALLSGGGFFAEARAASGLIPAGLPPIAGRSLLHDRSSPPAILPLTTGLTMKAVGQPAPPAISRVPIVSPVVLAAPRLRAVLQSRPLPTTDAPPQLRTTVSGIAAAKTAPRNAPPKPDTVPGARLHFVPAADGPRPTAVARSSRTVRNVETGWPLGGAHHAQFQAAEASIQSNGVTIPAGATHIWDIPAGGGQAIAMAGQSAARVTFLTQAGYAIGDLELMPGNPLPVPDSCAMIAVTCLGNVPGSAAAAAPISPGLGAITFHAGSLTAVVGWQTGNLVAQAGSATLLGRGCVITLSQPALTAKRRLAAAQATVRVSEALADQPGVETWLPKGIGVVGVILDIQDASATQDGDLAIAVENATLSSPPVRIAGGNRKMLLYDVAGRDDQAPYIGVSVASRLGVRVAGVVGLGGNAREWGIRLNGRVPEHWVGEGPLTPDGQILVRMQNPITGGVA